MAKPRKNKSINQEEMHSPKNYTQPELESARNINTEIIMFAFFSAIFFFLLYALHWHFVAFPQMQALARELKSNDFRENKTIEDTKPNEEPKIIEDPKQGIQGFMRFQQKEIRNIHLRLVSDVETSDGLKGVENWVLKTLNEIGQDMDVQFSYSANSSIVLLMKVRHERFEAYLESKEFSRLCSESEKVFVLGMIRKSIKVNKPITIYLSDGLPEKLFKTTYLILYQVIVDNGETFYDKYEANREYLEKLAKDIIENSKI